MLWPICQLKSAIPASQEPATPSVKENFAMRRMIFALAVFLLYGAAKAAPAQAATPGWPSLAQQLAEDHVIPGSALEKLIKDNQDFSRLLSEEASDPTIRP